VAKVEPETKFNDIVLTPEAETRLGLATAAVESKQVSRVRAYGGEIALPPGASLVVSAPVGGRLQAPSSEPPPVAGALVAARQPIFLLTPLLSPERDVLTPAERVNLVQAKTALATSQITAEGQVQQARVQYDKAKLDLERAERLLRDQAGTKRAVDDAQAQFTSTQKSLEAAESLKKQLDGLTLDAEAGKQNPLTIESPQDGMIRAQHATAGEVVSAGAPLFEVMRFDPIWVRVPVYAGETGDLALDQPAQVLPLTGDERASAITANPIAAPPTATLLAATVDLYYELPNPKGILRPGERMTVRVKLKSASEQRVVPWSAVVYDIYGSPWVYENTDPHTYVRRRVQVKYVVDKLAVLETGPNVGAKIVTASAMELFATQVGYAK
jgi:RND family efflux transporter MFP subunit